MLYLRHICDILVKYLSTFLSHKLDINGINPIICMNFTFVLLQECHKFTLVLLQTFDTILIYCQLYTRPNPTLMRFYILFYS